MAIRLCHSCAREVRDGDKVCRYCNAILDESHSVIEIGGEEEGFSFGSNKNAYEDEALKNFKQEQLDVNYEKVSQDKALATYQTNEDSFNENDLDDDMDDNDESIKDVYKGVIEIFRHPKDYIPLFVGLFSCLLIIGSIFLPLYVTAGGKSRFMYEKDLYSLGLLLGVCLILALMVIFKFRQKYVVIPAICIATMLVYLLIYFAKLETFGKLGFGYYILWFASVMLISSAVILNNTEGASNKDNLALNKKDFIWMVVCLLLSVIVINRLFDFVHMEAADEEPKVEATENTSVKIVVEDGNVELKILDTYIVKDTSEGESNGKDFAIVKVNLDNKRQVPVKFDDIFSINVYQNGQQLSKTDQNIDGFELDASTENIDGGTNKEIYFGYELFSKDNINVSVSKNSNNVLVFNDNLKLNEELYPTEEAVATEAPVVTKAPAKQPEPKEQNETPVAVVTEAPAPTPEPVVSTPEPEKATYDIVFKKPDYWGDKIWIYVYMNDETDSELLKENAEWPGVEMTMVKAGLYKYTVDEEWVKGNSRCLFSDGEYQYPDKPMNNGPATGVTVTGTMNISIP